MKDLRKAVKIGAIISSILWFLLISATVSPSGETQFVITVPAHSVDEIRSGFINNLSSSMNERVRFKPILATNPDIFLANLERTDFDMSIADQSFILDTVVVRPFSSGASVFRDLFPSRLLLIDSGLSYVGSPQQIIGIRLPWDEDSILSISAARNNIGRVLAFVGSMKDNVRQFLVNNQQISVKSLLLENKHDGLAAGLRLRFRNGPADADSNRDSWTCGVRDGKVTCNTSTDALPAGGRLAIAVAFSGQAASISKCRWIKQNKTSLGVC